MKPIQLFTAFAVSICSFAVFASPVNINAASAIEIADALSGVGISKAEAIVAYRKKNGMFKSPDDVVMVKGIGNSTFEKNRSDILIK